VANPLGLWITSFQRHSSREETHRNRPNPLFRILRMPMGNPPSRTTRLCRSASPISKRVIRPLRARVGFDSMQAQAQDFRLSSPAGSGRAELTRIDVPVKWIMLITGEITLWNRPISPCRRSLRARTKSLSRLRTLEIPGAVRWGSSLMAVSAERLALNATCFRCAACNPAHRSTHYQFFFTDSASSRPNG